MRGSVESEDGTGGGRPRRDGVRRHALWACLALGVVLLAVVVITTPWGSLPGPIPPPDPERDFTAAEIARERAFSAALRLPSYAGLLVGLAAALVAGLTPLGARLARAGARLLPWWPVRTVVAAALVTLLTTVVALPFDAWRETILRAYGLSTRDWGMWAADQARSYAIGAGLAAIVVLAVVALARRLPRRWWIPATAGGFLLVVLGSFVYPLLVEPVFNTFTPMREGPLRTRLLALAARDGVPVRDVLVADASRRTTALNAYVSGFGSTRRIVVYDTLLERGTPEEVRLVVAHELGHAERGDVLYGTLVGGLAVAAATGAFYLVVTSPRLLRRAGATGPGDPRSVGLLLATVTVFSTLGGPAQNLISRHIEARADVHALDLTRDPATFARMQRSLSLSNIADLTPNPVEYALYASHPTGPQRIAMAIGWARLHDVPEPPPLARRR
ncbi:MAG: M48 family metalloprotease [Streptosporangiales bacterium]|nr:M48 family metalloprotease [Streptosporangiales bacterium]